VALAVGLVCLAAGVHGTARAQHQEFFWDFTECFDHTIRSQGTEFVDAARFSLPGGCHIRFLNAGESWMQATFFMAGDPANIPRGASWTLAMYHLAITPNGPESGLAPVRVTLNGQEVWNGPLAEGRHGPGNLWSLSIVDVGPLLRRGQNTLRWEFDGGGATHYWLKIVRIGWDN
jgi:hypothetical protein